MIKTTTLLLIVVGFLFTLPVNAQIMDDSFFEVFMENYRQYSPPRYDMDVSKSDFVLSATEMSMGIDLYAYNTNTYLANLEQFKERILEMIALYEWMEDTGSIRTEAVRVKVLFNAVKLLSERIVRYGANGLFEIMEILPKHLLQPTRLSELYQKELQVELSFHQLSDDPLIAQFWEIGSYLVSRARNHGMEPPLYTYPMYGIDEIHPEALMGFYMSTQVRLEMLQIMYQVSLAVNLPYMNIPRALFLQVYNDYYERGEMLMIDPERKTDSKSNHVLKADELFTRILQYVNYPREASDEPYALPPELEIIPTPTPPLEPMPTPTLSQP